MDKSIIEFNKKFDKQKQELIDGFKALGEEKRLPKALATIEGEQPTYKDYFKAAWQSRQAEIDQKNTRIAELERRLNAVRSLSAMRASVIRQWTWERLSPRIKSAIKRLNKAEASHER
ncbi:hypothetical protein [Acinetobacter larvae]|uniref:hypothetical protein n=1 Tax=Acinetobacter larvae TaxID=1789224 RepID=UPI001E4B7546|nr:hypothetical protein [Acinetobacter larvae]